LGGSGIPVALETFGADGAPTGSAATCAVAADPLSLGTEAVADAGAPGVSIGAGAGLLVGTRGFCGGAGIGFSIGAGLSGPGGTDAEALAIGTGLTGGRGTVGVPVTPWVAGPTPDNLEGVPGGVSPVAATEGR
jgi:hypothetical protein